MRHGVISINNLHRGLPSVVLRPEAEVEILDVRQNHDGLDIEDKPVDLVLRMLDEDVLVMRPLSVLRKNEYLKIADK